MVSLSGEKRFSYADFCVEDDAGRREVIVGELQAYVMGRLVGHIEVAMSRIVADLNSLGHRLELDDYEADGFSYVDCSRAADEKRLRLAVDVSVIAGFE